MAHCPEDSQPLRGGLEGVLLKDFSEILLFHHIVGEHNCSFLNRLDDKSNASFCKAIKISPFSEHLNRKILNTRQNESYYAEIY